MSNTDRMLDFIYDLVDESFINDRFSFVDSLLLFYIPLIKNIDTNILLGLLTATYPGKGQPNSPPSKRLWKRKEFFDAVKQEIDRRPELLIALNTTSEKLLSGLE